MIQTLVGHLILTIARNHFKVYLKGGELLMMRIYVSVLSIILFVFSLLWFSSCTKQVVKDEEEGIA